MAQQHTSVCVIMAGGSGERFWPLSRQSCPKQLLRLNHPDKCLLEETIDRVAGLIDRDHLFIATSEALAPAIAARNPGLPAANILGEPARRNTAGCMAFVAAHLAARYGAEADTLTMAVLSADHLIPSPQRFQRAFASAMDAARRHQALCVMGARPTRPETGYGYIEIPRDGALLESLHREVSIFPVSGFREKPDERTAREFLATERFLWNTGMFFWTLPVFREELDQASPVHSQALREMAQRLAAGDAAGARQAFEAMPDISIDYALMEKSQRVIAVKADFEWDDIGSWDAMDRTRRHDEQGNVAFGDPVLIDTRNCVVYNEPGAERMAVAALGVEDLAIIVSGDAVLVIPKNRAQDVKQVVAELKARQAKQL